MFSLPVVFSLVLFTVMKGAGDSGEGVANCVVASNVTCNSSSAPQGRFFFLLGIITEPRQTNARHYKPCADKPLTL